MAMFISVCVRDRAAETYGMPFFVPTESLALRSFVNEVNRADEKNPLFTNSEDFELYVVGTFDDSSGVFERSVDEKGAFRPKLLAVGKDVKRVIN